MAYRYQFLSRDQFPQIHQTFLEAFAEYYVDTSGVTETMLYNRAVKNGVDFDVSVGAFDADRMVAMTRVGLDDWGGAPAAFDREVCAGLLVYYPLINWITTLVVKRDRRRCGVASALLDHFAAARPSGEAVVKLVNIDHNDAATLALLEKAGCEPLVRQFEMELTL